MELTEEQRNELAEVLRARIGKTRLDAHACVFTLTPLIERMTAEAERRGYVQGYAQASREDHPPERCDLHRLPHGKCTCLVAPAEAWDAGYHAGWDARGEA